MPVIKTGQTVYVCSNKACDAVWDADPQGHCPRCKHASGVGWSTMSRPVISMEAGKSGDEARLAAHNHTLYQIERLREWWNWSGPRPALPVTAIGSALAEIDRLRAKVQAGRDALTDIREFASSHATKAENVLKPDPFAGVLGEFAGGYASARRDLGKAVRDMADVALSQPAKTEGAEG